MIQCVIYCFLFRAKINNIHKWLLILIVALTRAAAAVAVLALLCCARPLTSRQSLTPWAWRNGDVGQGQSALPAKRWFPRWRALFPRWHSPPIGPDAPCCSSKQTEYSDVFVCSFYLGRLVEWSGASDSLWRRLFGLVCLLLSPPVRLSVCWNIRLGRFVFTQNIRAKFNLFLFFQGTAVISRFAGNSVKVFRLQKTPTSCSIYFNWVNCRFFYQLQFPTIFSFITPIK